MVSLEDLLSSTYAPIQMMVLPYLHIADVIALTRTCRGFGQLLPMPKATAWNVNNYLRPWFSDPRVFRSVQGRCGALLVGGFARRFLRRIHCRVVGIELIVTDGLKNAIYSYLEGEGYTLKEELEPDTCGVFLILATDGQEVVVNVHHSAASVAAQAFDCYDTTASMIFMS